MKSVLFCVIFVFSCAFSRPNRRKSSPGIDVRTIKSQLESFGVTDIQDVIDDKDGTKVIVLIKTNGSLDAPISRKNSKYICNPDRCNTVCQVWQYEGGLCNKHVCTCLVSVVRVKSLPYNQKPPSAKKKSKKLIPTPVEPYLEKSKTSKKKDKKEKNGNNRVSPVDLYIAKQIKKQLLDDQKFNDDQETIQEYNVHRSNYLQNQKRINKKRNKNKNSKKNFPVDIYEYVVKEKQKSVKLRTPPPDIISNKLLDEQGPSSYTYRKPKTKKRPTKQKISTEVPDYVEEGEEEEESGEEEKEKEDDDEEEEKEEEDYASDGSNLVESNTEYKSREKTKYQNRDIENDNSSKLNTHWKMQKLKQLKEILDNANDDLDRRPPQDKLEEIVNVGNDISSSYVSRKKKDTSSRTKSKIQLENVLESQIEKRSDLLNQPISEDQKKSEGLNKKLGQGTFKLIDSDRFPQYLLSNYGHARAIQTYAHIYDCGKDAAI